LIINKLAIS